MKEHDEKIEDIKEFYETKMKNYAEIKKLYENDEFLLYNDAKSQVGEQEQEYLF